METVQSIYEAKVAAGLHRDPAQELLVKRLDLLGAELRQKSSMLSQLRFGRSTPRGVYVWGDVGRGKSMLVEALIESNQEVTAKRMHFHVFMCEVHRALHKARTEGKDEPIIVAADSVTDGLSLLVLDELEITDIVDAMIVGRVFERAFARGIVLVATSNRPPKELYRHGLKRELFVPFVKLIESCTDVIHLNSDTDYRRRGAFDQTFYIVRTGDDAVRQLDCLWEKFATGAEQRLKLGKSAKLLQKGQMLRASFETLCQHPLAASDYLDMAQAADTLFLDGVPRLGERDYDAVRRFILLVDTLYDKRCGLVVTAAAPPEALYAEGAFTHEFRRTISRLYEMSGPDWPGSAALR